MHAHSLSSVCACSERVGAARSRAHFSPLILTVTGWLADRPGALILPEARVPLPQPGLTSACSTSVSHFTFALVERSMSIRPAHIVRKLFVSCARWPGSRTPEMSSKRARRSISDMQHVDVASPAPHVWALKGVVGWSPVDSHVARSRLYRDRLHVRLWYVIPKWILAARMVFRAS